jgi:hypothetical protein
MADGLAAASEEFPDVNRTTPFLTGRSESPSAIALSWG